LQADIGHLKKLLVEQLRKVKKHAYFKAQNTVSSEFLVFISTWSRSKQCNYRLS